MKIKSEVSSRGDELDTSLWDIGRGICGSTRISR